MNEKIIFHTSNRYYLIMFSLTESVNLNLKILIFIDISSIYKNYHGFVLMLNYAILI